MGRRTPHPTNPPAGRAVRRAAVWETVHEAGGKLAVHRHHRPYAALVLDGLYEELSVDGRYACGPGLLVIHPAHHAHANRFGSAGARVVNLALPAGEGAFDTYRVMALPDPQNILRLLRVDARAAAGAIGEEARTAPLPPRPWLGAMALRLGPADAERPAPAIRRLAAELGVTASHAARAFKAHYGVGPAAYRRELRVRRALRLLLSGRLASDAALEAGFADQSHMGREVRRVTGSTPRRWHRRARRH